MSTWNTSIKVRLSIAFGTLAALVLLVSGLSLKELNDSNDRFAGFVDGINARTQLAQSVRAAVDDRAVAIRNLVLVTTDTDREMEKNAVSSAEGRVESRLAQFNTMVANATDISDKARALAGEMSRIETLYRPVALEIDRLALNNQHDAAVAMINAQCRPLLVALVKACDDYAVVTGEHAHEMVQRSADQFASQRRLLVGVCFATLAIAVIAGIVITRSLLRALGAEPDILGEVTQRVAAGDLGPVRGATDAPVGSVLASMAAMQASLVSLIGQVRTAADSIATGSSQIAAGNTDLSSRTEQQAASLQETASSMEQLTSTVLQNAGNAQQASALSANASEVSLRGNAVVGQVVSTMAEISASSIKIADITGIIEGIAFQTNILALNAAVEAARAGEQGRGFAVVASEVRSLAQRSSSAAKEIKDLINASVQKIRNGSTLANEAGRTMSEVTQAVGRVTDIMGEIAAASTEQGKGIEQVRQSIAQMDEVTQQNAALVEEAAAASKSLEDQAQRLNQAIAFFRIAPAAGDVVLDEAKLKASRPAPVRLNLPAAKSVMTLQRPAAPPPADAGTALAAPNEGWNNF